VNRHIARIWYGRAIATLCDSQPMDREFGRIRDLLENLGGAVFAANCDGLGQVFDGPPYTFETSASDQLVRVTCVHAPRGRTTRSIDVEAMFEAPMCCVGSCLGRHGSHDSIHGLLKGT
jgi:hypothetical protein